MRKIIFLLLVFILSCQVDKNSTSINTSTSENLNTKDSLAFELCAIYGFDQGIRDRETFMDLDRNVITRIDLKNFLNLIAIVEKHGFPNEQLLGDENWKHECVSLAATAIMLHNPHRLIQEEEYFDLFLEEVNKGNMSRTFLADVLDKYYWSKSRGQKVMYGSQFGTPCIETKDETNKLRKKLD